MVSVLVLTYNEELNLPLCLKALNWCDDVVILDSYSDDRTVEVAESFGARVVQRGFDNYASQRNFGLNEIDYKYPWVFMVDADEEATPELAEEISVLFSNGPTDVCLYRLRRKDFFLGHWIKHSSGYPTWAGRLVKKGYVTVERAINEEYHTDGEVGFLKNHLNHFSFNKGFSSWLEKHNRYSSMEADLIVSGLEPLHLRHLFSRDPANRRKYIKGVFYRLPFRPLLMFFGLFIFKSGWLDGRAGFIYCLLRSYYEFMINCKVKEMNLRKRGLPL